MTTKFQASTMVKIIVRVFGSQGSNQVKFNFLWFGLDLTPFCWNYHNQTLSPMCDLGFFFSFVLVSLRSFLFLLLFLWRCFQFHVPRSVADTWQKWRWWFVVVLVVYKRWSLILLRLEGKRGVDQVLPKPCACASCSGVLGYSFIGSLHLFDQSGRSDFRPHQEVGMHGYPPTISF
jgi:hypothetical protein